MFDAIELFIKGAFAERWVPYGLSLAIIVVATVYYLYCVAPLKQLQQALRQLLSAATRLQSSQDFDQDAQQILESFDRSRPGSAAVAVAWADYLDGLSTDDEGQRTQNARSASNYFDDRLLERAHVNIRGLESLPNILVGVGLVATFVGLVAALLVAKDNIAGSPEQAKEALSTLLQTAAGKFITSVSALMASMVITWKRNARLTEVDKDMVAIALLLDRLAPSSTPEGVADQSRRELTRQSRILSKLPELLAEALDAKMKQTFPAAILPLGQSIDTLTVKLGDINQTALETLVRRFTAELNLAAKEHTATLGKLIGDASAAIGQLPERMEATSERFSAQIGGSADELAATLVAACENVEAAFNASIAGIESRLADASTKLRTTVKDSSRAAEQASLDLTQAGAELQRRLSADFAKITEDSTALVNSTLERIEEHANALGARTTGVLDRSLSGIETSMTSMADLTSKVAGSRKALKEAHDDLVTRFQEIIRSAQALEAAFGTILERTRAAQAPLVEIQSTAGAVQSSGDALTTATNELNGRVQRMVEAIDRSITLLASIGERGSDVTSAFRNSDVRIGGGVSAPGDAVDSASVGLVVSPAVHDDGKVGAGA